MGASGGSHDHAVVIAGAGVAGLEALVALRRQAPPWVCVTLVDPATTFAHRALDVEAPFGGAGGRLFALATMAADLSATFTRDALSGAPRAPEIRPGTDVVPMSVDVDQALRATAAHAGP